MCVEFLPDPIISIVNATRHTISATTPLLNQSHCFAAYAQEKGIAALCLNFRIALLSATFRYQ
jgi:hypothetical protein